MKFLLFSSLTLLSILNWFIGCKNTHNSDQINVSQETRIPEVLKVESGKNILISGLDTFTDLRDGERYATIMIGEQKWFAENLRYACEGSMVNPENPNKSYGRLYYIMAAQTACPNGWHLPKDREWDEMEMAHGMPFTFIGKGGWRGTHAVNLKSSSEWGEDGNGANLLGFNAFPAGYYFSDDMGDLEGIQGLGFSAAFYSAMEDGVAQARFMFSSRVFVNKWPDTENESGSALSCRCVQD